VGMFGFASGGYIIDSIISGYGYLCKFSGCNYDFWNNEGFSLINSSKFGLRYFGDLAKRSNNIYLCDLD